jgi:hypothetical protein
MFWNEYNLLDTMSETRPCYVVLPHTVSGLRKRIFPDNEKNGFLIRKEFFSRVNHYFEAFYDSFRS